MSCCVLCDSRQIPPLHLVSVQCGRNTLFLAGTFFFFLPQAHQKELRKPGFSFPYFAFLHVHQWNSKTMQLPFLVPAEIRVLDFSLVTQAMGGGGNCKMFLSISFLQTRRTGQGNVLTGVVINVAIRLTHSQSRGRS